MANAWLPYDGLGTHVLESLDFKVHMQICSLLSYQFFRSFLKGRNCLYHHGKAYQVELVLTSLNKVVQRGRHKSTTTACE